MPLHRSAYQIRGLSWPRKSMPKPFFSCAVPSVHGLSAAALCTSKPFPLRGCSFPVQSMAPFFFSHAGHFPFGSWRFFSIPGRCGANTSCAKPIHSEAVLLSAHPVQGSSGPVFSIQIPGGAARIRFRAIPFRCKVWPRKSVSLHCEAIPFRGQASLFRRGAFPIAADPPRCASGRFLRTSLPFHAGAFRCESLPICSRAVR